MAKKREERLGPTLVKAAKEMLAYERGDLTNVRMSKHRLTARESTAVAPPTFNKEQVAGVRKRLKFSQTVFASVLNVAPATVRAWEQGQRSPDGASSRLLQIAKDSPESIRVYLDRRK